MIAAHGGVGFRADPSLSVACADSLRDSDVDVVSAVSSLEDNPLFNCGYGSNPTMEGTIEFGAVGAVSRIRNPCRVARTLALNKGSENLIDPMVLVGPGAENYARKQGFSLCDPNALLADTALQKWKKAKIHIEKSSHRECLEGSSMDTVGAVFINDNVVEACTSSGGIMLKTPGRLGHCTVFGSGMWAERRENTSVGISASGCGEALVRADFCRALANKLLNRAEDDLPSEIVRCFVQRDFLNSPMMAPIAADRLYAGGIVLLHEDERFELIVFHNTSVFPFAYRHGSVVRKRLSQLPQDTGILDNVVEACTSSGGIMLKTPGRLGHCTIFGSGMWAERRKNTSVGISASGCGEALVRADFCRALANKLLNRAEDDLPSEIVRCFVQRDFLNSPMMAPIAADRLYAGGIVLLHEDERFELIVFHNTSVFPFAYRHGSIVRKRLSQLPQDTGILVETYMC
ncbi:L-asparaginase domain protein [Oesophagostomum dentatum]|uniref:L-asparaginase domain protein n=1 Tax=Oesophagostomum dentatum TaxID=61180 RepID=A0A0B1T8C8_OESDE|nr:L-asparaginase domain protein [Oesophagostomum dentatum]